MKQYILKINGLLLIMFICAISSFAQESGYCPDAKVYDTLNSALKEPEKVISLDIALNHLTEIPAEIGDLVNLECLDISFNLITDLPKEFEHLKKLKYLNMSGTRRLAKVPRVLASLPLLSVVDISDHPEWGKGQFDDAVKLLPKVKFIRDDKFVNK